MHTSRKRQAQPGAAAKSPGAGTLAPNGKFSLISDEKLIGLYKSLLKCRALNGQLNGSLNGKSGCFYGHEAAVVGTAIDLGAGDLVFSLDGGLLTGLSDGNAIDKLLADSDHARFSTPKNGQNGKGAAACSFTHAAIGTALACKTAKTGKVSVIYSHGANFDLLSEAIHLASVHALPIIFVQQLDGASERPNGTALKPRRKNRSTGATPWYPSIAVDTHDVVAVYRVANEAISRARLGGGPTVIECRPFVLSGKTHKANGADPLLNMEHYLRAKGLFDPKLKNEAATGRC